MNDKQNECMKNENRREIEQIQEEVGIKKITREKNLKRGK